MKRRPLHLAALLPVYRIIKRYRPDWLVIPADASPDVYASAMMDGGNSLFRLILPPFFKKIRFELADENELMRAAREGTIVYVARGVGQLEYGYFAHLFREVGLPSSSFTNDISLERWMPWRDLKATLTLQLETLQKEGGIANPVSSGWLTDLVAGGKSALLSIRPTELEDESILLSYSQKLLGAVISAGRKGSRPVYLVPLEFIWDKRPSRANRSIVDILFGEKENPGRIRKMVLFWRNYNYRAVVKIGEPIDLAKFLAETPNENESEQARRLGRKIHTTIKMEHRTVTGPLVRSKGWFVERVLVDEAFQQKICELAAQMGRPADDLRELARRYVKEIAADINYTYIEVGDLLLGWVLKSLFTGLVFNQEGLAQAKRLYSKAPVVFVPNHKSHMDYLILADIFYNNNMTIPHVAAGLNLSFWPLGQFFRRCGGYFIRRSFENNKLYRLVIETYLRILLEEGYAQEFFIEGGRSRTGKLMPPRYGMIRMLSKAVADRAVEDLHFIPVSFTYDRVIEQKSYEDELGGESKEKEKPSHLLRLVKYLKRQKGRYGKIYVNFGAPVSYQEVAKQCGTEGIVETIAQNICREINRNIVVTPQSIVAAAILANPLRAMTAQTIYERSSIYLDWLKAKGTTLSQAIVSDAKAAINNAISQFVASRLISLHEETDVPIYLVDEDKRLKLDYFKNGSVHFFASVGVVSTLILKQKNMTAEQLESDFGVCKAILKHEFRYSTRMPITQHITKITDFLAAQKAIKITDDRIEMNEGGKEILAAFSSQIQIFLESIKIALASVKRQEITAADEKELVKIMMAAGKNMLLLGYVGHREAISKANFTNAMRLMCDLKILTEPQKKIFSSTNDTHAIHNLQVQLERLF